MAPFVGFPRGVFQGGSGNPLIAAELRNDLGRIAEALDDLALKKLSRTAEVAVRQTLSDIVFGITDETRGQFEMRTSVLDHNSCEECRRLNGTMVRVGTEEHAAYKPPNFCLGKDRCRCVYDPVPSGHTGLEITSRITESSVDFVRGEVAIHRVKAPELGTPRLAAIAKARRQRERGVLREVSRTADDLTLIEAQRIIQRAFTQGKPVLSQNLLGALEYLTTTGMVPPIGYRSGRPLTEVRAL